MRLWFNLIIVQVIFDNNKIKSHALSNCFNTRLEDSFDLQDNFVLCGWIDICQLPGHPVFSFNCWHFIELIYISHYCRPNMKHSRRYKCDTVQWGISEVVRRGWVGMECPHIQPPLHVAFRNSIPTDKYCLMNLYCHYLTFVMQWKMANHLYPRRTLPYQRGRGRC